MKKLLAILGAFALSTSVASTVVACSTNQNVRRFSVPVLPKEISDEIMMAIKGDPGINPLTKGKFFSQIDFDKVLKMMLQDAMSKLSQQYFQNDIETRLKLNNLTEDFYVNAVQEMNNDVAQNQFYNQYTQRILSNGNPLDIDLSIGSEGLYALNPENLLKSSGHVIDNHVYYLYFKRADATDNTWLRWQYSGEFKGTDSNKVQLPTIQDLELGKYLIVKNDNPEANVASSIIVTDSDLSNPANLFWNFLDNNGNEEWNADGKYYSLDGQNAFVMNGKTGLRYRFQEYFRAEISNNFYENILTMTYLESQIFNVNANQQNNLTRQDAFLNISSDLAKNVQTWNQNDGYKSKLKMVWSFSKTDKTAEDFYNAWRKLNETISFKNNGEFSNSMQTSIMKVLELLNSDPYLGANQSELGSDPFFNLAGYNGIVKNDGESISSADGTLNIVDEAKGRIANINSPAIITKDQNGEPFVGENNRQEIYVVLPIYLIDLLNDTTNGTIAGNGVSNFNYGQTTSGFIDVATGKYFKSFGDSLIPLGETIDQTKIDFIQANKNRASTNGFYLYVNNAAYTINDFNTFFGQSVNTTNIWDTPAGIVDGYQGFLFTMPNSVGGSVYGNIGIGEDIFLGPLATPPSNQPGIVFTQSGRDWYVKASDPNLVGKVINCGSIWLSFDDGQKGGTYTYGGTLNKTNQNAGRTMGYTINMGPNQAKPNMYISNGSFNYYDSNLASVDVTNLATSQKRSLLHQLEFIASKDSDVSNSALSTIYPLFLKSDQILFEPLYQSIRKYLVDDGGGESD